jgi:hypothetical protein
MAATVGAGIQDGELLDQLAKRNLTAVAGTSMGHYRRPCRRLQSGLRGHLRLPIQQRQHPGELSVHATVGAGIQDGELLDQLAKRNLTAVAGTSMVRACALLAELQFEGLKD